MIHSTAYSLTHRPPTHTSNGGDDQTEEHMYFGDVQVIFRQLHHLLFLLYRGPDLGVLNRNYGHVCQLCFTVVIKGQSNQLNFICIAHIHKPQFVS